MVGKRRRVRTSETDDLQSSRENIARSSIQPSQRLVRSPNVNSPGMQ